MTSRILISAGSRPYNVVLIKARPAPDSKSIILHLRETGNKEAHLSLIDIITGKQLNLTEVDMTGSPASTGIPAIGPLETRFYKVSR